jgi:hypothetical protein
LVTRGFFSNRLVIVIGWARACVDVVAVAAAAGNGRRCV